MLWYTELFDSTYDSGDGLYLMVINNSHQNLPILHVSLNMACSSHFNDQSTLLHLTVRKLMASESLVTTITPETRYNAKIYSNFNTLEVKFQ